MKRKWTKESVFSESRKYSSKSEFKKRSSGAYNIARENEWLKEMKWLTAPIKLSKWTREATFLESKNYNTTTEFQRKKPHAYDAAKNNGWLEEMTWLSRSKRKPSGYWNVKDHVFEESRKYKSTTEFQKRNSRAYNSAKKHGWIDEMIWLSRSNMKPAGYWNIKGNVFEEAHNYTSRAEFCSRNHLAYKSASDNGWLDQMDWLRKSPKKKIGYWNIKEHVFEEARKYQYKSDFHRWAGGAYASARQNNWLAEMTWFQPKGLEYAQKGPVHLVYVYVDDDKKKAYVGATNSIKRRDYEHRTEVNDPVYKYFKSIGKEIPIAKILRDGLTVIERQREERIQSLYYRDVLHYELLNKINLTGENTGSIGSLVTKWPKSKVIKEAGKYKTPTEFFTNSAGAYDAALRYRMMNKKTFPWFYSKRVPPRWWNVKEHVFEESKKYKTLDDFFWNSPSAHFSARKHKWLDEMVWLERLQAPQGYWKNEVHVIEESRKYSTKRQFCKGCHAAFNYANEHNLWDKMPWIKVVAREKGYWTRERVFAEGTKYSTKMEFKRNASTAYSTATKNNWISEMTWFVSDSKPMGYWQIKQNVIEEAHKYSSRSEFRWGAPVAYRSSINNGWIDEMTWFKRPQNNNVKWTRENVFAESHKYDSRGAFKKGCSYAYKVARLNGWLDEMLWLK